MSEMGQRACGERFSTRTIEAARPRRPHAGDDGHGPEGVRDAAMMLELFDGAGESPEDVEVGGLGGQHRSERGVGRLAVESGAADAGAG